MTLRTLILPALLASAGCTSPSPPPREAISQVMEDFTMTQTQQSRKLWTLKAPEARLTVKGRAQLASPEILFYQEGRHTSTARSERAFVRGDSRDVSLEGDVVIKAHQDDITLKTDRLLYSASEGGFRTDDTVVVIRPGARVRGRGLKADSALSDITIFRQETTIQ